MSVSLPFLSLAQKNAVASLLQEDTLFPVTYGVNRTASGMANASGFSITGIANTPEQWLTMVYTPPVASAIAGLTWQGFYFNNGAEQFVQTSFGIQLSYLPTFTDTTSALAIDNGNIIYWNEFSYGFQNNFGAVNKQRYSYHQNLIPYSFFLPANVPFYLFPYIRIPTAYRDIGKIEQSITLHLMTTNRKT
jgi:hypothetical protein